jgi:hypothetical protein
MAKRGKSAVSTVAGTFDADAIESFIRSSSMTIGFQSLD